MSKKSNKKNLSEESNVESASSRVQARAPAAQQDPMDRMLEQNEVIIDQLKNMANSLNALVYYSTKTRGVAADIEKDIGAAFVTEATRQAGVEQTYPSVDATDQRTDFPGTDDRVAYPENVSESTMSDQDLKDLIREQLFIIRKNKNG
mgnify:CR=1 FL=1|jgi:hypothetical protein